MLVHPGDLAQPEAGQDEARAPADATDDVVRTTSKTASGGLVTVTVRENSGGALRATQLPLYRLDATWDVSLVSIDVTAPSIHSLLSKAYRSPAPSSYSTCEAAVNVPDWRDGCVVLMSDRLGQNALLRDRSFNVWAALRS